MTKEIQEFNDPLLAKALKECIDEGMASTSLIQRKLCIGYPRAARMMDIMEERGYVSSVDNNYKRQILISLEEYMSIFGEDND